MVLNKKVKGSVSVPAGVTVTYENDVFTVTGPAGTITRKFLNPQITVKIADGKVDFAGKKNIIAEKMHMNTIRAHLKNMIIGAQKPYVYELKICSGHFPMTAAVKGQVFELKNFLGENKSRQLTFEQGVKVVVSADKITVESPDKEATGRVSAALEQLTRITNRDRRIFQDGIYLVKRNGEPI
jgi:large subunit ribosomal protein L6